MKRRYFYAAIKNNGVAKNCKPGLGKRILQTDVGYCPCFEEGREFVTDFEKPTGFCDWAWRDLHPNAAVLLAGGNFSKDFFEGWMKCENTMIVCCTDGVRPVVFKIERVE